jgi:hypothetical protein
VTNFTAPISCANDMRARKHRHPSAEQATQKRPPPSPPMRRPGPGLQRYMQWLKRGAPSKYLGGSAITRPITLSDRDLRDLGLIRPQIGINTSKFLVSLSCFSL